MSELVFKRGQGWVYENPVRTQYIELLDRAPAPGERYTYISYSGPHDDWFLDHETKPRLNLEVMAKAYRDHKYEVFVEYSAERVRYLSEQAGLHFITVKKL